MKNRGKWIWIVLSIMSVTICAVAPIASAQSTRPSFKFSFAGGKPADGVIAVAPDGIYSKSTGYGFEPGAKLRTTGEGTASAVTSDTPFFFSVVVPEGNYNVTVTLGDPVAESTTTVKAELRRLMSPRVHTSAGQFTTRTFTVNIRTPDITGGGQVKLKDREKTTELWNWDEKLTLQFSDSHPSIQSLEIAPATVPTVYILGDSTVCDQPGEPYNSWGQMLTSFFKPAIALANHAESGESTSSSIGALRLKKITSIIQPGDYLLIQYGHNDEKDRGANAGAYKNFTQNLQTMITEARAHQAIPILFTPVSRKTFNAAGQITNSHGDYPDAVRKLAAEQKVPLIDLQLMTKDFYEALGPQNAAVAFATKTEGTHHSDYGSYEVAKCVVESIKKEVPGLAKYLVDDLPTFDPKHPDAFAKFGLPADAGRPAATPLGQ